MNSVYKCMLGVLCVWAVYTSVLLVCPVYRQHTQVSPGVPHAWVHICCVHSWCVPRGPKCAHFTLQCVSLYWFAYGWISGEKRWMGTGPVLWGNQGESCFWLGAPADCASVRIHPTLLLCCPIWNFTMSNTLNNNVLLWEPQSVAWVCLCSSGGRFEWKPGKNCSVRLATRRLMCLPGDAQSLRLEIVVALCKFEQLAASLKKKHNENPGWS